VALGAAVLGDEFRPDVLAAATGESAGTIAATLERLVHVRVLGRSTQDDTRFRFVHALIRQSLVDRAPADERRAAHRAAARALEALAPASPDLFGHYLAADDHGSYERLVDLGLQLADDLNDRGAPDEAAATLESLLGRVDAAPEATRAAVLMALATAEFALDRLTEARRHLREAAGEAVASGDPTCLRTGMVLLRPPTSAEHDPASVEAAAGLLALAEPGSRLQASAQCWLSAEVGATDVDRAVELAGAALDTARRLRDPALLRLASLTWHLMARAMTDPVERRAVLEAMLQLPGPAGRGPTDISAWVFLAGDHLEVGDRAGAERAVQAALAATTGFGDNHLRWLALRNQVMLAVLDDELDRADALLAEATAVASALPIPEATTLPVLQQVLTRYHQRRLDELQPLVAAFDAVAPPGGPVPIVRGYIEAELGHPDAPASVDRAVAAAFAQPRAAGWVGLTAVTVEAAAAVGHERTAELAALLEPRSGQHAVIVTIGYLGAIDRYLGLAAAATGDLARGRSLLHRAQDQHRQVGAGAYLDRTAAELEAIEPAA
jgi:tetratricopeptide (TPR) repeat protein